MQRDYQIVGLTEAGITDFAVAPENVCWSYKGYSGEMDFNDIYLGIDRNMEVIPTVTLNGVFENDTECANFLDWWDAETTRGVDTFLIEDITLFGKKSTYGVRQISPIKHSVNPANTISFKAEVLFNSADSGNTPPESPDMDVSVQEDSQNNYIELKSSDAEGDELSYEIIDYPTNGVLRGNAPALSYTPDAGFIGVDTFTYKAKDVFNVSNLATVTITVGAIVVPDAAFTYHVNTLSKYNLEVKGNYYYKFQGDTAIRRGTATGIYIDGQDFPPQVPDDGKTLTIYSDDHTIANGLAVVSISVENWGERTNYESFCENHTGLQSFSASEAIGSCKGRIFTRAFKNCPIYIPAFDTSNGTHFAEMFMRSGGGSLANFDLSNGIYFQAFMKESSIVNTQVLDTAKGEYMQEFFMDSAIQCCAGISTMNAINTTKMFSGVSGLTNPDTGDQALLLQGGYTFVGTACQMDVSDIELVSSTPATIDTIDGSAEATTTHKVIYSGNAGVTLSFKWYVNGTLYSSATTNIVTISSNISEDTQYTIRCEVTDDNGTVDSGTYTFTAKVNYTFLQLDIPKQYSLLNLRSFIDANNPQDKTEVLLTNTRTNCSMETGDLTGLNVKLVNTGRIEGFRRNEADATLVENRALTVTSPMTLDNKAFMAGCGGEGGNGGKGKDDTYTTTTVEREYPRWTDKGIIGRSCIGVTHINWKGVQRTIQGAMAANTPYDVGGVPVYLGPRVGTGTESPSGDACDGTTVYFEYSETRTSVSHNRTGGAGGNGGNGLGYGATSMDEVWNSAWRKGEDGKASNPSGGNSGGDGGSGGWWGADGYDGQDGKGGGTAGQVGFKGSKGLVGSLLLKDGSNLGTIYGGTD